MVSLIFGFNNQDTQESDVANDLALALVQPSPETESIFPNIQDKMLKLKLGRGRGRPKKVSRSSNFFDFVLKNSKRGKKSKSSKLRPSIPCPRPSATQQEKVHKDVNEDSNKTWLLESWNLLNSWV